MGARKSELMEVISEVSGRVGWVGLHETGFYPALTFSLVMACTNILTHYAVQFCCVNNFKIISREFFFSVRCVSPNNPGWFYAWIGTITWHTNSHILIIWGSLSCRLSLYVSIRETYRMCRTCTFHFKWWQVHEERRHYNYGVHRSSLLPSQLNRLLPYRPTPTHIPHLPTFYTCQLITHSAILIILVSF